MGPVSGSGLGFGVAALSIHIIISLNSQFCWMCSQSRGLQRYLSHIKVMLLPTLPEDFFLNRLLKIVTLLSGCRVFPFILRIKTFQKCHHISPLSVALKIEWMRALRPRAGFKRLSRLFTEASCNKEGGSISKINKGVRLTSHADPVWKSVCYNHSWRHLLLLRCSAYRFRFVIRGRDLSEPNDR
jgi:hypothetical protein